MGTCFDDAKKEDFSHRWKNSGLPTYFLFIPIKYLLITQLDSNFEKNHAMKQNLILAILQKVGNSEKE